MPPTSTQPNPNDPDVINLTKAIFQHESGMDFNAVGDAGTSHGAGQWQPDTWKAQAKEVLGDENSEMSEQNQKAVAQYEIAKDKAAGLNPAQIAAKWNSGSPDGWENKIGTTTINGQQIKYNVPQYVKSVTDLYQQNKSQGASQSQPTGTDSSQPGGGLPAAPTTPQPLLPASDDLAAETPTAQPDNLGTDLGKRLQEGGQAASEGISAAAHGKPLEAASGLLQTVGAGAGAIGDVVNRVLELVPGVKQAEGFVGNNVASFVQTPAGQKVSQSIQDFTTKHPELSKDIGAGFNIITAIPILRGLGTVADIGGDAIAQALKKTAEESAQKGFSAVVSSTKTGAADLARNPDAVKTLIEERAIPDIESGKYTTKEASDKLDQAITHIEDTELQPELAKANSPAVSTKFPFSDILKSAEAEATQAQESFGPIKNELELIQKKYGDYITLQQMNDAKRVIARKISQAAFGSPDSSAMKVARSVLQQSVEDGAKTLGLNDVAAINQKMARLIKAQNILKYIDRKAVKNGVVGGIIKDAATGAGEVVGNATGVPLAGAYVGRETGGLIGKRITGIRNGILRRTGKDSVRTPFSVAKKKIVQGVLGTEAQKANRQNP